MTFTKYPLASQAGLRRFTVRFSLCVLGLAAVWTLACSPAQPVRTPTAKSAPPQQAAEGRTVVGKIVLTAASDPDYDLTCCTGSLKGPEVGFDHAVTVAKDGSFRVAGVPAGEYDLAVDAGIPGQTPSAKGTSKIDPAAVPVGGVRYQFAVASRAADRPLDIGTLQMEVPKWMTGKDEAPDFTCVTMDGEEFALKSQRGKYVLLEFWTSWCGFCRTENSDMKKIYDDFGKDPRFVMIGLSLDKEIDKAEKYVKQYALKWPQGILGNWAHDKVSLAYGIGEVPTMILIGPDGKIVAKATTGKAMHESVAQALAKRNATEKTK